jgi:UV excision repair protein RAD23
MSPEQLNSFAQMMASMPPEQMQQLLAGMGGMGGPAAGGARPNVVRLTEDEMAAVQRLVELGFDQNDAVQAFLACDRNEALAANLLMDGWNADADGQGAGAGAGAHGSSGGDDEYS